MIEGPPFPRANWILAGCLAICASEIAGWLPSWLAALFNVGFACAGSYALGLLSERKRRYQDSIEHHEEMIRMHRATQAFIAEIQGQIEGHASGEKQ